MNQNDDKKAITIRRIEASDNPVVAEIIRLVMTEFDAVGCGYSISDSEVDDMHSAYAPAGSAFFVVELDGQVYGCGGFGPLKNADDGTCELRKMYFKAELRGLGVGAQLLDLCLEQARQAGFKRCYLETKDNMQQARRLYGKFGFEYLDQPMGDTGHTSCGTWMVRKL